ncbi:unannotated protein [freshwater metagenome]|uniref:Unannotated protein n=1 Tax=freshwater metagenome TaxID=449393 RepID=A0A6J6T8R8_9ZZZZ
MAAVCLAALLALAGACSTAEQTNSSKQSNSSEQGNPSKQSSSSEQSKDTQEPQPSSAAESVPRLERDGDAYRVPDPLPTQEPGRLLAVTPGRSSKTFGGVTRIELLYVSSRYDGQPVAVSGTLLTPKGAPPEGGWPIVSWGHGTTGVADVCAPSTTENLYYNEYAQQVRSLLATGYAVAASDYIGLATPGPHSYTVGVDLGNAMADIVPAARSADPKLSTTWFAIGHSEGGQAALFATRSAARHPDLHLAATVAIAPTSSLGSALQAIISGGLPADVVYGLYLLVGLSTVDPSITVEQFSGPAAAPHLDLITQSGCLLDAFPKFETENVDQVFNISPTDMARISGLLAAVGNPDQEPTVGPLLLVQGEDDQDIPAGITELLSEHLQQLGVDVTLRVYPDLGHDTVLGPATCETLDWLAQHGGPTPADCVPEPTDMS